MHSSGVKSAVTEFFGHLRSAETRCDHNTDISSSFSWMWLTCVVFLNESLTFFKFCFQSIPTSICLFSCYMLQYDTQWILCSYTNTDHSLSGNLHSCCCVLVLYLTISNLLLICLYVCFSLWHCRVIHIHITYAHCMYLTKCMLMFVFCLLSKTPVDRSEHVCPL